MGLQTTRPASTINFLLRDKEPQVAQRKEKKEKSDKKDKPAVASNLARHYTSAPGAYCLTENVQAQLGFAASELDRK